MLTHSVFFSLIEKDNSAVEALVSACHKYLAPHDGIVFSLHVRAKLRMTETW